ncbi:hypothetical protein PQI07_36030 [Methylobacterium sp. 092160098-2]|jgi:hypothetical protein|uniref:hypothetical protein n=1 Tax=Methylobacterium sp. 092160098-2 TaxID=3025129 RepID=UPI002381BAB5|nr:hypothetical protein [Methylobacterium sp. 092160098-2]MDE4915985.1 hypothetical protein [Methylobacterium sp. 092160098-2]
MKLSTILPTSAAIAFVLTAGLALAQGMNDQPSSQGGDQKTQQGGGMGGMKMGGGQQGGMGMGGGKQGGMGMMGMGGMGQPQGGGMGQGGGKQGGCGMMGMMGMGGMGQPQGGGMGQQQGADVTALQERVNQLEQRLNAGQAQPSTPTKPQ